MEQHCEQGQGHNQVSLDLSAKLGQPTRGHAEQHGGHDDVGQYFEEVCGPVHERDADAVLRLEVQVDPVEQALSADQGG